MFLCLFFICSPYCFCWHFIAELCIFISFFVSFFASLLGKWRIFSLSQSSSRFFGLHLELHRVQGIMNLWTWLLFERGGRWTASQASQHCIFTSIGGIILVRGSTYEGSIRCVLELLHSPNMAPSRISQPTVITAAIVSCFCYFLLNAVATATRPQPQLHLLFTTPVSSLLYGNSCSSFHPNSNENPSVCVGFSCCFS